MCGIAGVVGGKASDLLLDKMLHRISHRGEVDYQKEKVILDKVAIGMNRLAIVDEELGMQPFSNNGVYCIFNGEIYNWPQLRRQLENYYSFKTNCDTEVILHSYLHWGDDFVSKLDGKFGLCIVDTKQEKVILARDHIGIKPLYFYRDADSLLFSSEMKSFIDIDDVNEISLLPPAHMMINGVLKKYYHLPKFSSKNSDNNDDLLAGIKSHLIKAIQKRIPSGTKKISCLLSGGLDSSLIVYIARQLNVEVEAFTFAHPNKYSEDLAAAAKLCQELNIKHIVVSPPEEELMNFYLHQGVYVTESYEPVLVRNAVAYHYVCKAVRAAGYKFVLNGEGADEIFGGYAFFKEVEKDEQDKEIYNSLLNLHKTYLQMADRASMYTTLEARLPYLDQDFMNFCLKLPSDFRIRGTEDKWALRQIFKDVLPDYITMRPKVGMNEGAGFGRNIPTQSIYFEAVKRHYYAHPLQFKNDLEICSKYGSDFTINLEHLEEVYNFPRYVESGYHRYEHASQRLQLNTRLLKELIIA